MWRPPRSGEEKEESENSNIRGRTAETKTKTKTKAADIRTRKGGDGEGSSSHIRTRIASKRDRRPSGEGEVDRLMPTSLSRNEGSRKRRRNDDGRPRLYIGRELGISQ